MISRDTGKDTNSMKEMRRALEGTLASFNEGVRDYLKDNLRTEGEEKVADKVRIHLGIYSDLAGNPLTQFMDPELNNFSIAMIYEGEHGKTLNVRKEELQSQQWWEDTLETNKSKLVKKEQNVSNSITDGFIGEVGLVFIGEIKSGEILLRERLLLETMMDILSEALNDTYGMKDIKKLLEERGRRGYKKFIEAYVAKVFEHYKIYPVLKEEDCIRLSHERYEGREEPAKVYIGERKEELLKKQNGEIICWRNGWERESGEERDKLEADKLEKRKIRYYRKMMELCKNNKYLITCFDEKGKVNILGATSASWLESNNYKLYIDFSSNGEWYIKEGEEEILCYIKGVYYYSKTGIAQSYGTQLKEESELEEGMVKEFRKIIECLSKQEHGAGMIVAENAGEIANEFCIRYSRGIVLTETLDLTDEKNREFLLGMTSIDGMLLVDKKGRCHAFGVILDGKAWIKANPARGSRYNSAVNYIYDKEGSFAVIISEDKTVDIVGKSIREKELQE